MHVWSSRAEERMKTVAGEGKKSEILGDTAEEGSGGGAPKVAAPRRVGPRRAPGLGFRSSGCSGVWVLWVDNKFGQNTKTLNLAKVGLAKVGQNIKTLTLAKIGQSLGARVFFHAGDKLPLPLPPRV